MTDHYSTVSICGPNSRKILSKVIPELDVSDKNFSHMSFKNARIGKINCRVMRISFTGELSYEINIQANYGKEKNGRSCAEVLRRELNQQGSGGTTSPLIKPLYVVYLHVLVLLN